MAEEAGLGIKMLFKQLEENLPCFTLPSFSITCYSYISESNWYCLLCILQCKINCFSALFLLPGYDLAFLGLLNHLIFTHSLSVFQDFVALISSPYVFMSQSLLLCFSGLSWESETICMFSICHLNLKPWLFKMFNLCLTSWDLKRLMLAFFISCFIFTFIFIICEAHCVDSLRLCELKDL